MNVLAHDGSLEGTVVSQNVLLTGLTGLVGDVLIQGVTVCSLGSLEGLQICGELGDSGIGDGSGESLEVGGSGHEVGFATEAYEDGLATVDAAQNSTLSGFVLTTLGKSGFTFLTKDFNGTLEVAGGFFEGLLAVHHAGAGHVTQLLDIC